MDLPRLVDNLSGYPQDAGVSHTRSRSKAIAGHTAIHSFDKAKKLRREVFARHGRMFYCDCVYRKDTVDSRSCGYQPEKNRYGTLRARISMTSVQVEPLSQDVSPSHLKDCSVISTKRQRLSRP
jgi:endonuclease I